MAIHELCTLWLNRINLLGQQGRREQSWSNSSCQGRHVTRAISHRRKHENQAPNLSKSSQPEGYLRNILIFVCMRTICAGRTYRKGLICLRDGDSSCTRKNSRLLFLGGRCERAIGRGFFFVRFLTVPCVVWIAGFLRPECHLSLRGPQRLCGE